MATEWFIADGSGLLEYIEDPNLLAVTNGPPDWIMLPLEIPHEGSRKMRVHSAYMGSCPKCRVRRVRHLVLDEPYKVAECNDGCGYVVYTLGKVNTGISENVDASG